MVLNKRINPLCSKLGQKKKAIGTFVNDLSDHNARWLSKQGVDFCLIDFEHHPFDLQALRNFLVHSIDRRKVAVNQSLTLPFCPLVRIPSPGYIDPIVMVKQVLDSGACGIVFPYVETADQVYAQVTAMSYPSGKSDEVISKTRYRRGFGAKFASWYWGVDWPDYYEKAAIWPNNKAGELLAFCQIESPKGLENLDDILEVEQLTGVMIGPADYSIANGCGLNIMAQSNQADFKEIIHKVRSKGKFMMVLVNPDNIQTYYDWGIDCCILGFDGGLHQDSLKALEILQTLTTTKSSN